ncbi:MAG: HD domain-containing protein [Deltaproteobacteria bacterium]
MADKEYIIRRITRDAFLREACSSASALGLRLYAVGGLVRDMLLKRPSVRDYDLAVDRDARGLAMMLAGDIGAAAFPLDLGLGSFRVAKKTPHGIVTIDVAPFNGRTIVGDLKKRDFTINAVAINAAEVFEKKRLSFIDPCRGIEDLEKGVLRAVSVKAFDQDPLRTLRAARFSHQFGLEIERGTLRLVREKSHLLSRVSWERIRDEFSLIFSYPRTVNGLKLLFDLKMIDAIAPECAWANKGYNLKAHSLKTVSEAEKLMRWMNGGDAKGPWVKARHILSEQGAGLQNSAILKMLCFLHDAGKPLTMKMEEGRLRFIGHEVEGSLLVKGLLKRLRFSRRSSAIISGLVKDHHRAFMLLNLKKLSFRAKAHFFRATGGVGGILLLLCSLADARATRAGEDKRLFALVTKMLDFYFKVYIVKRPPPLLNGHEVMRIFKMPQGRLVGEVLSKISEAVQQGIVKDKKGAVQFIKDWLSRINAQEFGLQKD